MSKVADKRTLFRGCARFALRLVSFFLENPTGRISGSHRPVGRTARAIELMQITQIRILKYAVYFAFGHPATSPEQCNNRINYYCCTNCRGTAKKDEFGSGLHHCKNPA